ncbi:MAG: sugar ABC transporter ATP-binding protein [Actinobacteria bacterium]|nr:sugar ABC transporter ATP-binding protein [Actinomycetota bacterium]
MLEANGGAENAGIPLVRAEGIVKSFPGVKALSGVAFECRARRVHAIVGENGAGKSTLAKIIAGFYQPDEGRMVARGREVTFGSPRDALTAGIAMVYQEFTLLPHLSVTDNIWLGHEPARRGVLNDANMKEQARDLLMELGMADPPLSTPARRLSVAEQQIVEIAKALAHDPSLLLMDEPSAVLGGGELDHLYDVITRLVDHGVGIVYVSHRLAEIEALADDVTVMRDGCVMWAGPAERTNRSDMVHHMVGRSLDETFPHRKTEVGDTVLEVKSLLLPGTEPEGISFHVKAGEILGVAGMVGSGRSRLARALVGVESTTGGSIKINGNQVPKSGPRAAARNGLVFLPEDRKQLGLVLDFTLAENISLPHLGRVSKAGVISRSLEDRLATDAIEELSIRTSGPQQAAQQLSGGNQQKVVLGKWLAAEPSVFVLDEPLRGVDVGAKAEIYRLIRDLADRGTAIMLISSELPEILGLSDRIIVMRDGLVAGEVASRDASEETILSLAVQEKSA